MALSIAGQTVIDILKNNLHYCQEHQKTLFIFNSTASCNVWQDAVTFYYKSIGRNIASGTSSDIQNIINQDLGLNLSIISAWGLVDKNINVNGEILIDELIPYEIFNPQISDLLYFNNKDYRYYKNKFYYTEYLKLREEPKGSFVSLPRSFIYTFIFNMVTSEDDFKYLMEWLSSFFQNLKSSSSLVLVCEKSVSENIFWEEIIIPIFGKEFCLAITASILKKEEYSRDFANDKTFYNINSLNYFSAKSKKTKDFINQLSTNENSQTLFNFSNENNPILEELTNYKTIKTKPLKSIVKDMGCSNEKEIYKEIEKDLMNFSKILSNSEIKYT